MSEETKASPREKIIRQKIIAGLSREQAEQVIADQEAHDAELAAAEDRKAKGEKKAAKGGGQKPAGDEPPTS